MGFKWPRRQPGYRLMSSANPQFLASAGMVSIFGSARPLSSLRNGFSDRTAGTALDWAWSHAWSQS
jgi:hypothetical protein